MTLESTEIISVTLSSFPSVLELRTEASTGSLSTQLTLSGLAPGLEYHKYEDDLQNHVIFVADANGSYVWAQDLTAPHLVFIQTTPSTYIIQDNLTGGQCTLIGSWDAASKTCTLGMDLSDT
ncbi:MAG: hypothetical protein M1281_13810, partial [Chloroflexi bacterium]|nr:hypothetical protein [Chloroflexota bacterium]